ncbi:hypothetical protein KC973_01520 [Candidatus Saccharibacteria bacterium]|nr:hypothetical protein [Candidatus Saccharibacteria bacterium]
MNSKKFKAPKKGSKIHTGGHTTHVEGLMQFLRTLESWPEVTQIRVGRIRSRNVSGRAAKQVVAKRTSNGSTVLQPKQVRKNAHKGGGFSFRATRWSMLGNRVNGIKCDATYGTTAQEVILMSHDLELLKQKLRSEGYCPGTW